MGARTVEGVVERRGPIISSEIVRALQQGGASAAASRKRLERAVKSGKVRRLARIRLPHNESLIYRERDFKTDRYFSALHAVLRSTGSAYGVALMSLAARGGLAPISQFGMLSGSPTNLTGHIPSEGILSGLVAVGLVRRTTDPVLGDLVVLASETLGPIITPSALRARLLAESLMLASAKDWFRKNGLAGYGSVKLRPTHDSTAVPDFAHIEWDLSAPSYVHPFADRTSGAVKPGFVVADVVLGQEISLDYAQYFLNKTSLYRNLRRVCPALAMLIATRFTPEAMRAAARAGVIFTTPGQLLGSQVGAALESLIAVLTNAAEVAASDPKRVAELFAALSRIEGIAGNLRGPLFELITGMCVRAVEGPSIDMGVRVTDPDTGGQAEIDVLRVKGHIEVSAYECKGREPGKRVSLRQVEEWLNKKVPLITRWMAAESRFSGSRRKVAFWTSGTLDADAVEFLETARTATQKYDIEWKDGDMVYAYAARTKDQYAIRLLDEHYRKHPLAT